jgi:molybdopterin converting factor small subunit
MSRPPTQDEPRGGQVTLRYWAAARAAAGVAEEQVEVAGPVSLAELVSGALARHGGSERLEEILATCSVLLGDKPVATQDPATVRVSPGESVEFLPPFAGG